MSIGLREERENRWELRPDLEMVGADSLDGRPALLVHDPVTGDFDRVEWPESDLLELLRRPRTVGELRSLFIARNPLVPDMRDVADFLAEIGRRGWLRGSAFWPERRRAKPAAGVVALVSRLMFFQIPLLRPEHFLRATAGLVRLLFNPATLFLLMLCGLVGLYLALPRWEDYWQDSLGSFSLAGLPAFLLALVLVKTAHEFSHAYAAAMAGARVPSMGVAFFFLMPLPFTDVTDAWRLPWSRRLRVAMAGMRAEMTVAGVALLLWALSPPGDAAVALARLSSVALVSTLLTNLNPGPRFDGYYALVCLFRMENLRSRSMNVLRRLVWKPLFGVELPDDEAGIGFGRRAAMLAYACYAIFYRISLGTALVLMTYYLLPKVVGLPLAAVEAWMFFVMPAAIEERRLVAHMSKIRFTLAMFCLLAALVGAGVWVFGEWPRRLAFPAVTRAASEEAVRTQRSGIAATVAAERGRVVAAGDVLAVLDAPEDAPLLRQAEWAYREAELSLEQSWRGEGARRNTATREAEAARRRVELEALRQRSAYLDVPAPASGTLAVWDASFEPGVPTGRGRLLGWITDGRVDTLSCYPDMETAGALAVGGEARFYPDDGGEAVAGTIVRIDESRPEFLEDGALAQVLGAVRAGDAWRLPRPYAKVEIRLRADMPRIGQTGTVWVWSRPESLAARAWNWLRSLAVRESAF